MRILYWDDSDTVLAGVTAKLQRLNHTVLAAKTIEECRVALSDEAHLVDLFIADHSIDEANGMTFIMGAKAMDPELHVVVLTPSILRSEFNQLRMCGIEVLKKPILIDQVVRPFMAPNKRRKKKPTSPEAVPPGTSNEEAGGLLGRATEPASPPAYMPPVPPPEKKKKGLTRLFSRGD